VNIGDDFVDDFFCEFFLHTRLLQLLCQVVALTNQPKDASVLFANGTACAGYKGKNGYRQQKGGRRDDDEDWSHGLNRNPSANLGK